MGRSHTSSRMDFPLLRKDFIGVCQEVVYRLDIKKTTPEHIKALHDRLNRAFDDRVSVGESGTHRTVRKIDSDEPPPPDNEADSITALHAGCTLILRYGKRKNLSPAEVRTLESTRANIKILLDSLTRSA